MLSKKEQPASADDTKDYGCSARFPENRLQIRDHISQPAKNQIRLNAARFNVVHRRLAGEDKDSGHAMVYARGYVRI